MTVELETWISWKPESQPGSSDGWEVDCSRCGHVGESAIHSLAVAISRSHLQWHINNKQREEQ